MSDKGDDGFTFGLIAFSLLCLLSAVVFHAGWFAPNHVQSWDRADNPFMEGQYARRR